MSENKTLIITALIMLALLGGDAFFLRIINKKAEDTRAILAASEKEDADKEKSALLEKALEDTSTSRGKIDSYFVKKGDAVSFIERLETTAKRAGLQITLSSVSVPEKTASFRIEMSTVGSFEDTLYFLSLLQTLPHKIHLEKVGVRRKSSLEDAAGEPPVVLVWDGSFTLTLESFINS